MRRLACSVVVLVLFLGGMGACSGERARRDDEAPAGSEREDGATEVRSAARGDDAERALAAGRRAAAGLSQQLQKKLMAAISEGPARAIDVCSQEALATAESLSTELGVEIRRVSKRYRNPADRPDPLEASILEVFAARPDLADTLVALTGGEDTASARTGFLYMKPIRLSHPRCLRCHGAPEEMDAQVKLVLARLYPEDKAVGFALGDLRGAFSVRVPGRR